MLKDINDKSGLTFFDGTVINNIEEIKEHISYHYDVNHNDIIGFAKFKPFLRWDNRFCNQLDINSWYPITSVSHDLYIQLIGVNKTHLGLFESVVAVDKHKKLFDKIKNDKTRVIKYWARKNKEKTDMLEAQAKLKDKMLMIDKQVKIMISDLGVKPKRKQILTSHLMGKYSEENLFHKMENKEFKDELIADIEYRLKTIKVSKSLKYGSSLGLAFPYRDNKWQKKLFALKDKIENPIVIDLVENNINFIGRIKNKILAMVA